MKLVKLSAYCKSFVGGNWPPVNVTNPPDWLCAVRELLCARRASQVIPMGNAQKRGIPLKLQIIGLSR